MTPLVELVARHKSGQHAGIYSLCSAHPLVIESALYEARASGTPLLIEATSNQVNQFGGYTGLTPAGFRAFVHDIADRVGYPTDRVWLGGDHLGPNAWRQEVAATAMGRAEELVALFVTAGFRKLHLDCSMSCADDPSPLPEATVARRAARLCAAAERAWREHGG
ncbi:MAG TPA: class II D-tagatose-bisphosphate aldolase, non-catalytic subunit, partial [Steroidobacteraceae bacterium]|nr:class II D-tagatose-bisphosphate aldolase, non-catalytic subunit [Steroidobacteraceae bacterium]